MKRLDCNAKDMGTKMLEFIEMNWNKITLEDKPVIDRFYKIQDSANCETTFANNWLWAPHYEVKYGIIHDMLVFYADKEEVSVRYPIGEGDKKPAIDWLKSYFAAIGQPFLMHLVSTKQFAEMEALFPGEFEIQYDRDAADYIYESQKLATLTGKKLHGKRNHINRFKELYPDWSYETITEQNREECIAMAYKWRELSGCADDPEKSAEFCVTLQALKNMTVLGLKGGLLRAGNEVVAFSLGEPCSTETYVVHIEKAYSHVQGAYPMINQQFVLHEAMEYEFVNREEDTGVEGLRKAKLSYQPVHLLEKGTVRLKTR